MLRSMYSGISGMKGFQNKLDVIGNNISNVNTYGYKKGRVTFQDMMSQSLSNSQGPTQDQAGTPLRGGTNPSQVGLGSQVSSIDNIHTQGNRQTTNRPLDLALEGDGMFVLAEGNENAPIGQGFVDLQTANTSFTRAGNFYLDNEGFIVNNDGKYLVGEGYQASGAAGTPNTSNGGASRIKVPTNAESFSISNDGTVNYINEFGESKVAGQIRLAKFSNPGGLNKDGGNTFTNTDNAGIYSLAGDNQLSTLDDILVPGQEGAASVVSGALEMSNVDLSEEFTSMITAQRGFQANTRIITTSDEILQELVNLKR